MEGEKNTQESYLVLAYKLFLLTHPDVQDIEKVRLRDEVFAAVKADGMPSHQFGVGYGSVCLDTMRAHIDEELKKLDEKG